MTSAPNQRDDNTPLDTRPMLSPIRTSSTVIGGAVNNSTRLPYFAEQPSAHVWPPTQHYPSSAHQSSSSGHVHASPDQASYHYHQQQPQPLVVSSNVHDFPRTDLEVNASAVPRFEQSLSPVDNGSALQQQQQQVPSSSSPVSTKSTRGSGGAGAGRGARGGAGKPPVSVSNKNTPGSGSAGPSSSMGAGGGRSSQPKSSRKQFTACGACQHRQVKCDLKDKITADGETATCTACFERGINCISAYPQNQKPKAQRRGKRLRVVEEMFGKKRGEAPQGSEEAEGDNGPFGSGLPGPSPTAGQSSSTGTGDAFPSLSTPAGGHHFAGAPGHAYPQYNQDLPSASMPSCIPVLHPDFLDTSFYRSFHTQRPIIDPHEFRERFIPAYQQQQDRHSQTSKRNLTASPPLPLASRAQNELELMANVLVTWAASYGIDEYGREDTDITSNGSALRADNNHSNGSGDFGAGGGDSARLNNERKKLRRDRVTKMVKEVLEGVDRLALLRRPTWDGVRVLMLLMPLTEDALGSVDRLSMYQSTISQIYTLCTHGSSLLSGTDRKKMVVARIFWYAYVHEGITSGLRGGKLIFDNDDLQVFEASNPKFRGAGESGLAMTAQPTLDRLSYKFSTAPIRLSTACRQINHALTGPKASLRRDVDEKQLRDGWEKLHQSWEEFDELREVLMHNDPNVFLQRPDMERFISGWQIFLFECLNIIREVLCQKMNDEPGSPHEAYISEVDDSGSHGADHRARSLHRLHELSESYCRDRHPRVMHLITQQLTSPTFFQWDASLVRDGTFYAGKWAATDHSGRHEDVQTCISALRQMKWAFSLSEDRIQTIQYAFNRRAYGTTNLSPVTPFNSEVGSGGLREQVFATTHFPAAPSIPSDSAGMAGQDPFETQWPNRPGYSQSSSQDGQRPLPASVSDSRIRHTHATSHTAPTIASPDADLRPGYWDNGSWIQSGGNGIPAGKLQRMSPDEIEAQQQLHRVTPPSASSSTEFHHSAQYAHSAAVDAYHDTRPPNFELSLPRSSTYGVPPQQPQWNGAIAQDLHPSSQGHPPFVRIESGNSQHSGYQPDGAYHHSQRQHDPHRHHHSIVGYHSQHGRANDTHSDEGSVNDVLYMADTQHLNRTRYPQEFMDPAVYKS